MPVLIRSSPLSLLPYPPLPLPLCRPGAADEEIVLVSLFTDALGCTPFVHKVRAVCMRSHCLPPSDRSVRGTLQVHHLILQMNFKMVDVGLQLHGWSRPFK